MSLSKLKETWNCVILPSVIFKDNKQIKLPDKQMNEIWKVKNNWSKVSVLIQLTGGEFQEYHTEQTRNLGIPGEKIYKNITIKLQLS